MHIEKVSSSIGITIVFFSLGTPWSQSPYVIFITHKVPEDNLRMTHEADEHGPSKGRRSIRALSSNSRTVLCSQRKKWSMYISLAPYDDRRGTKWLMAKCRKGGIIDVTFRDASFQKPAHDHVFQRNNLLWHFFSFLRLLTSLRPPEHQLILLADRIREAAIWWLCIYNIQQITCTLNAVYEVLENQ